MAKVNKSVRWYEVWAMYCDRPPRLKFLWEDTQGNFEVYDPIEQRYVFHADNYMDAMYWLSEDEYTLIDGRMDDDTEVPVD